MSCYSVDFKDRERRKKEILESWTKFSFLELSYALKMNSVSPNSSEARVEWRMRTIPVTGGQSQETKSVLNVTFQKENNEWKIKEVSAGK
jgi:hypothetical protein